MWCMVFLNEIESNFQLRKVSSLGYKPCLPFKGLMTSSLHYIYYYYYYNNNNNNNNYYYYSY